jgi:NAD/NADP transhydrogenase beta subunit
MQQVGLAAVTTSIANYMLHDPATAMDTTHLVSTYLGTFVGAVTLTGECSALRRCKCAGSPHQSRWL